MDENNKQAFYARFPARAIEAMTPMIKRINEISGSLASFYRQEPTDLMGTYLVPAKEGAFLICTDARNLLALKCKKAFVKEPFKVNLTNKILRLCRTKEIVLSDVDGDPIYAPCTPKPDVVMFTEITCIIGVEEYRTKPADMTPEAAECWEEQRGILGGFETGRRGNYSDYRKYIVDPAKHLKNILSLLKTAHTTEIHPVGEVGLNLAAFAPIEPLINILGLQFTCRFHGETKPVEFISVKNEELEYSAYGLSMPVQPQAKGQIEDVVGELIAL